MRRDGVQEKIPGLLDSRPGAPILSQSVEGSAARSRRGHGRFSPTTGGEVEPVPLGTDLEDELDALASDGVRGGGDPVGDEEAPGPVRPEAVLSEIAHLLVAADSPDRVLAEVANALHDLVPHDSLSIFEADPSLQVLRPVLVRDEYADEIYAMGPRAYGVGLIGLAAKTGQPLLANDAHLDPRGLPVPGTPTDPESLVAIPLVAGDGLKGVLVLYRSGAGNHFAESDFRMAIRFGEMAALSLDNAQMRARLESGLEADSLTGLLNHSSFHEKLAQEIRRANRRRSRVGLLIFDLDHFRRINDTWGHPVGDDVLRGVAAVARETCRADDVICRIGGEEFAVILPGSTLDHAMMVAERLRTAVEKISFPGLDPVRVSVGVAGCPQHASSPRDLTTCAQFALLEAKESGRNRVEVYREPDLSSEVESSEGLSDLQGFSIHRDENPSANGHGGGGNGRALRVEPRSVAQLRMLHSLSTKLNRLNDVAQIGEAITTELRSLLDYHNCRVHLLDGDTLVPVAFRGELLEYQGETFDALLMKVGEGATGWVAQHDQSYYAPNTAEDTVSVTIPGTPSIDESLLVVPLRYGERVIGTIGLSKLGVDQFDTEDKRLLEVMASNAAVAFENARLFAVEREAARTSRALLELSQALTKAGDTHQVLDEAMRAIPAMIPGADASAWIQDPSGGAFRLIGQRGFGPDGDGAIGEHVIPAEVARALTQSNQQPFVLSKELVASIPGEYRFIDEAREVLVAPMRWEPDGLGAFVIRAGDGVSAFAERDVGLARGIADIASLALGNARRFDELERAYVSTVEALANALEAQDAYTEAHCRALAKLAVTVGAEMGMDGERLKHLELGAVFHDIGKIGVPSEIIRKPGPLTDAERRLMEQHTAIGAQILEPVPFLQKVIPIVRSSHERWDGLGYPDGVGGEDIPLESRIVFVCDAFHAMTTDRPYRQALPEEEAIRRLGQAAGTQFDPLVVATFTRLHRAGRIHIH